MISAALSLVLIATMAYSISAVSLPSFYVVEEPDTASTKALGISLLYCRWAYTRFAHCPYSFSSYNGVANFDVGQASAAGNILTIPFKNNYPACPICTENYDRAFMWSLNGKVDGVDVSLYNENGAPTDWLIDTYFHMGAMETTE